MTARLRGLDLYGRHLRSNHGRLSAQLFRDVIESEELRQYSHTSAVATAAVRGRSDVDYGAAQTYVSERLAKLLLAIPYVSAEKGGVDDITASRLAAVARYKAYQAAAKRGISERAEEPPSEPVKAM